RGGAGGGRFAVERGRGAAGASRRGVRRPGSLCFSVGGGARLRGMVELLIRWEEGGVTNPRQEYDRLFWKLPVGVGLFGPGLGQEEFAEQVVPQLKQIGLIEGEPRVSRYKEVKLHQLPISGTKYREMAAFLTSAAEQPQLTPFATVLSVLPTQEAPAALSVAVIDKALHVSANEALLKELIDEAEARRKAGKERPDA